MLALQVLSCYTVNDWLRRVTFLGRLWGIPRSWTCLRGKSTLFEVGTSRLGLEVGTSRLGLDDERAYRRHGR